MRRKSTASDTTQDADAQIGGTTRPGPMSAAVSVSSTNLTDMAGPGKSGRTHKGDRKLVHTRLPVTEADEIDDLAEQRGETRNDYVAALLRLGLKYRDELPPPATTLRLQGRFDLEQAS